MRKRIDKEKEVKLLHLDSRQKKVLEYILDDFIKNKKISNKDAVEAFALYITGLAEDSASGSKHFCDELGNLSQDSISHIQKFMDALFLCSGCKINHYKILSSSEIKGVLAKAASPRNRYTMQHINELEYKLKIMSYSLLDAEDKELKSYIQNTEDGYISSLASINPIMMKNAFIEHMIDMIIENDDHTISDIIRIAQKYSKYFGTEKPKEEAIENLMHKYNDIEKDRHLGSVHAARIELFKILEGIK